MPKNYATIVLNVSPDERDQIHDLAHKRGYKITSDYVRSLIEADAKAAGDNLKFDVNRGGFRGAKKEHV